MEGGVWFPYPRSRPPGWSQYVSQIVGGICHQLGAGAVLLVQVCRIGFSETVGTDMVGYAEYDAHQSNNGNG